jgi:transcriptional regulator with XRE-family HTH domain
MDEVTDNGTALRSIIESAGLTQAEALAAVNKGQAFPIALSTWKAYLAASESNRRRPCPDRVLEHARKAIEKVTKGR